MVQPLGERIVQANARRAASDLAGLLELAAQRRQADERTCQGLAQVASRIAELCERQVRS